MIRSMFLYSVHFSKKKATFDSAHIRVCVSTIQAIKLSPSLIKIKSYVIFVYRQFGKLLVEVFMATVSSHAIL